MRVNDILLELNERIPDQIWREPNYYQSALLRARKSTQARFDQLREWQEGYGLIESIEGVKSYDVKTRRLTLNQCVILFDCILPNLKRETSQVARASLLEKLSGYSEKNVRQHMSKLTREKRFNSPGSFAKDCAAVKAVLSKAELYDALEKLKENWE